MSDKLDFSNQTEVHRSNGQVSSEIDGESIILNLKDGKYYGLDKVGARIWDLIQEPKTVQQIQDELLEEFEVEPEACLQDLLALLRDLAEHQLIEVRNEMAG